MLDGPGISSFIPQATNLTAGTVTEASTYRMLSNSTRNQRRHPKPKGVALHLFRHSHGSHLLAAGMELPAVSERLGHSSVMVTATVYSHRLTGRDKEAATRWDEFQRLHDQPGTKQ
jgi:integrase